MRGVIKLAAVLLVGALIGLITAYQMIAGRYGLVSQSKGPWTVWDQAGSPRVDPYTRAHFLLRGRLPASHFEAVELEARVDDDGKTLDADCVYAISSPKPPARWWSLSAFPEDAGRATEPLSEASLIAQRVVYEPDGSFRATLSPEVRPGNWFKPASDGDLVLRYRLYNPDPAYRSAPLQGAVPSIKREVCL